MRRLASACFLQDGDRLEFYVRDGNLTRPLDVRAAYQYIAYRWPAGGALHEAQFKEFVSEALRQLGEFGTRAHETSVLATGALLPPSVAPEAPETDSALEQPFQPTSIVDPADPGQVHAAARVPMESELSPPWLRVATRKVLNLFLGQLASSYGWKRLYIISPWISELSEGATLSFDLLLARLKADGATVYLITRPPEEPWHAAAVARFADTGRVNVAFVPDLHVKLYTALTNQGAFAMLGSANFTQKSLGNREIGILVNAYMGGRRVVKDLNSEASQIYRMPGRALVHKADFRAA